MLRSEKWLFTAFTLLVALLFLDNLASSAHEQAGHEAALDLISNTAPNFKILSGVQRSLDNVTAVRGQGAPVISALRETGELLEEYLRHPAPAPERLARAALKSGWDQLAAAQTLELNTATATPATELLLRNVRTQIDTSLALNSVRASALALEIEEAHRKTRTLGLWADGLAGILAIAISAFAMRTVLRARQSQQKINAAVAERADELEAFSGRMAHDVLSPLASQVFAWKLVEQAHPDDERLRLLAGRGRSALARTQRLVDGLLEFALAAAGPQDAVHVPVGRVLMDVVEGLRPEAEAASVTLECACDSTDEVACNPGVLTSLTLNLARNAIKYMGASVQRVVQVSAFSTDRCVRIEVADTGPGIPADQLDRIFDLYVRGADRSQPGIGLGLATVKRLCEAHSGKVGVRSRTGQGSTFWFELPRAELTRRNAMSA